MDYEHHVIPRHEWKARFGNLDGFNATDNKVRLTREQHAQVHELLFELNNNPYDKIAFKGLSGQCSMSEASKEAERIGTLIGARLGGLSQRGRKRSPETCARISASKLGKKHSAESRANMGASRLGKKRGPMTLEQRKRNSESQKNSPKARANVIRLNELRRKRLHK
jgi:uncharacterized protein with WD repeat